MYPCCIHRYIACIPGPHRLLHVHKNICNGESFINYNVCVSELFSALFNEFLFIRHASVIFVKKNGRDSHSQVTVTEETMYTKRKKETPNRFDARNNPILFPGTHIKTSWFSRCIKKKVCRWGTPKKKKTRWKGPLPFWVPIRCGGGNSVVTSHSSLLTIRFHTSHSSVDRTTRQRTKVKMSTQSRCKTGETSERSRCSFRVSPVSRITTRWTRSLLASRSERIQSGVCHYWKPFTG